MTYLGDSGTKTHNSINGTGTKEIANCKSLQFRHLYAKPLRQLYPIAKPILKVIPMIDLHFSPVISITKNNADKVHNFGQLVK